MPNLPGSSCEMDKEMLDSSLYDERLQVDQYKIYPTAIVPWTQIKEWYDNGQYKPYDDILLYELIKEFKKKYKNGRDSIELLETFHLHILKADINTNMLICDSYYKMI